MSEWRPREEPPFFISECGNAHRRSDAEKAFDRKLKKVATSKPNPDSKRTLVVPYWRSCGIGMNVVFRRTYRRNSGRRCL